MYDVSVPATFAVVTLQCGSLILVLVRPRTGVAVHLTSIIALGLLTRDADSGPWPLPVTGFISLGALILLVGIRERWLVSLTTWWSSMAALVLLVGVSLDRDEFPDRWETNLTIYASYTVMVLIAAIAMGQRARIRADLAKARRDIELEQAQRLHIEERARIARELHDVVAHSMSLIHMRALSAPFRLPEATQAVNEEFDGIARSARSALSEMRQLLGALRSENDEADLLPQPTLSDVPELTDATSRAGSPVDLHIDEAATTASPIVQLTIYRVVQEALSNVVRHAQAAPTTVTIRLESSSLHVTVHNTRPSDGAIFAAIPTSDRGGQGLRGMRERVHLLGGQVTTKPTVEGGFLVDAIIPASIMNQPELP
ncbi:sensor histidine kinase [Cryobacterium lactosi]|uniref:histidine kinase n=1 Tax=Cryobacterium lactosi TaxID=1259202 RepID=A0A4R9BYI8_9MICO|nr:sensor histidine kinase [Cryobacterium lactosi]TFD92112.1 sensor histidine kinase [Cryobacterium lactosi]